MMTIAYLLFALVFGLIGSYAFEFRDFANALVKVGFMVFAVVTGILLLGALWPYISNGQMRLI